MQLPRVNINATSISIGLQTNNGKIKIRQPKANLEIKQPPANIQYHKTPSKLKIDQTKAWESMGLKHIYRTIEEYASKGKQKWLQGIARTASQGDQLMKIEKGGNPIAEQAKVNSHSAKREFNIGWIPPIGSVDIQYIPGKLQINVTPQKPVIESTPNKPKISFQPGDVNVYVQQKNNIHFDVTGLKVDLEL